MAKTWKQALQDAGEYNVVPTTAGVRDYFTKMTDFEAPQFPTAAPYIGVCWKELKKYVRENGVAARAAVSAGDGPLYQQLCRIPYTLAGPMEDKLHFRFESGNSAASKGAANALLALGWNYMSPIRWVQEGLPRFLKYWEKAALCPTTLLHMTNPSFAEAFWAFKNKINPRDLKGIAIGRLTRHVTGAKRQLPTLGGAATTRAKRKIGGMATALRRSAGLRAEKLVEPLSPGDGDDYRPAGLDTSAWSAKALARIGQLPYELTRVALQETKPPAGGGPIRIRDVNWEAVKQVQEQLKRNTTGRIKLAHTSLDTPRFQRVAKQVVPEIKHLRSQHGGRGSEHINIRGLAAEHMAPAFPEVRARVAQELAKGRSPADISGGALTAKEAHTWLRDGGGAIAPWYRQKYLPDFTFHIDNMAILRWLYEVKKRGCWDQLTRERTVPGPNHQRVQIRLMDRLDEIQEIDLVRGPRTTVDAAFEHAAGRYGSAWTARYEQDYRTLQETPKGWKIFSSMRHLNTPMALIREGQEMNHCVGNYVPDVEKDGSMIFSINVRGHRSTFELRKQGDTWSKCPRLIQHYGVNDGKPHPLCGAVLDKFMARLKKDLKPAVTATVLDTASSDRDDLIRTLAVAAAFTRAKYGCKLTNDGKVVDPAPDGSWEDGDVEIDPYRSYRANDEQFVALKRGDDDGHYVTRVTVVVTGYNDED